MKKILMALFFIMLSSGFAMSQGTLKYSGFSGGMMLHSGYLTSPNFNLSNNQGNIISQNQVKGFPFGLGGAARLHFGKFIRIGGEGYVSDIKYDSNGSNLSLSWGGMLFDLILQQRRFSPFGGLMIGGGSVKNISLNKNNKDDFVIEDNVAYREYTFLALAPFVGFEYALNSKIRLTLKADYIINLSNPQDDFATGARVFFGLMFYRSKSEK